MSRELCVIGQRLSRIASELARLRMRRLDLDFGLSRHAEAEHQTAKGAFVQKVTIECGESPRPCREPFGQRVPC